MAGQGELASNARPDRVLVVDDDPDVLAIVAFQVGLLGYEPVDADGLATALAVLAGDGADVVVTDLDLAGADGREVARAAHAKGIPTILMTGDPTVEAATGLTSRFLHKPVDLGELAAVLAAAIG